MLFVDAYLFPCIDERCPSPAEQVELVINEMGQERLGITRIWLDVEKYHWSGDKDINRQYIKEMVQQAQVRKNMLNKDAKNGRKQISSALLHLFSNFKSKT